MDKHHSKLIRASTLLFSSLAVGVIGFTLIERYTLIDALYMSVITISTVGYGEVVGLSSNGKIFTTFYILLNLGIFAYVVSMITSYLVEGELNIIFKNLFNTKEVKQMKNHTIICGFGRNGSKACEELVKNRQDVVIVEANNDLLQHYERPKSVQAIVGDATADEILKDAGIINAAAVITTLPSDADNVFITLTARELNPTIKIIARASDANSEKKLFRAGATHVVMPDWLGGIHMAQLIAKPYVVEFLELLSGAADESVVLDEIHFEDLKEIYHQKSLGELDIRKNAGVTILGLKIKDKDFNFNPDGSTIIQKGDVLIILGNQQKINSFRHRYSN